MTLWPHSESACGRRAGHAPFPADDPTRFADAAYRAPNRSDAPLPPLLTEVVHGLLTVDPARRLSARDALARLRDGGGERRLQAEVHDLRERNARLQAQLDEAAADARRQVVAQARKSLPTRCTARFVLAAHAKRPASTRTQARDNMLHCQEHGMCSTHALCG